MRKILTLTVIAIVLVSGCGATTNSINQAAGSPPPTVRPTVTLVASGREGPIEWELFKRDLPDAGSCVAVRTHPRLPLQATSPVDETEGSTVQYPLPVRSEKPNRAFGLEMWTVGGNETNTEEWRYVFGATSSSVERLEAHFTNGKSKPVSIYDGTFVVLYPPDLSLKGLHAIGEKGTALTRCDRYEDPKMPQAAQLFCVGT